MKNWNIALLLVVVLSILFLAGCGGSAQPAATTAPAAAPSQDTSQGQSLVENRCTVCHPLSQVTSQRKDRAGWTSTVQRMVGHGANLNADEQKLVIDYLVSAFPK
jgi:mono/diheme cytochrome c family protein